MVLLVEYLLIVQRRLYRMNSGISIKDFMDLVGALADVRDKIIRLESENKRLVDENIYLKSLVDKFTNKESKNG